MAMHLIMQEDNIDAKEDESIAILACLAKMQIEEDTNANPKRGGSKFGRRKSKLRMRVEAHCMLDTCILYHHFYNLYYHMGMLFALLYQCFACFR